MIYTPHPIDPEGCREKPVGLLDAPAPTPGWPVWPLVVEPGGLHRERRAAETQIESQPARGDIFEVDVMLLMIDHLL